MIVHMLRGAGQGKYISINNGVALFDNINKYNGLRYCLEILSLNVSKFVDGLFVNDSNCINNVKECLSILVEQYGAIDKGFLLDTSWYKDSYFVGSVYLFNKKLFVKCYKLHGEAEGEVHNQKRISKLYHASFNFANIEFVNKSLIAYKLIPNSGEQCNDDYMISAAVKMYQEFSFESNKVIFLSDLAKKFDSLLVDITASNVINISENFIEIIELIKCNNTSLQLLHCHGDYTTWNTVIDKNNPRDKYLIDYECCSERVLYTDIFHLLTQRSGLNSKSIDVFIKLSQFSILLDRSQLDVLQHYLGYLLEELLDNLNEWKNGKHHTQLLNLIESKFVLIVECYLAIQEG